MATKETGIDLNEMVPVNPPKTQISEDSYLYVGINQKTWQIPKGKVSYVPRYVAEVVNESLRRIEKRDSFILNEAGADDAALR